MYSIDPNDTSRFVSNLMLYPTNLFIFPDFDDFFITDWKTNKIYRMSLNEITHELNIVSEYDFHQSFNLIEKIILN